MKDIYDLFIKCAKNRDYESVAWVLNYVDPKALHDLICEENPTLNSNGDSRFITAGICRFVILSWSIDSGYITISVKFSEDEKIDYKTMLGLLYPKFPLITLSILYKENAFSIVICSSLEDCISTKFEKEYKASEEVHDGIPKSVIDGIIEEMSEDEIVEYDGGEHK